METPLQAFAKWAKTTPEQIFLHQPVNGEWTSLTWAQAARAVEAMARALRDLKWPAGSRIGIFSKNCAHWILADLAIWQAGYVSVPIFPTARAETVNHILEHSEAKLLFAGKLDHWERYQSQLPKNLPLVAFPFWKNAGATPWDEFLQQHSGTQAPFAEREMPEMATIIYTSGTSGVPKGVVHTFQSLAFVGHEGARQLFYKPQTRLFSFMPLAHVVERTMIELCGIYGGASIYFTDSIESFLSDLRTARPFMFIAVSRIWTKLQEGILKKMPERRLRLLLMIPGIASLVRQKIRAGLGLDQARWTMTGGSSISPALVNWFERAGILIREGYGLTENMGYSHFGLQKLVKKGTVGRAVDGVETKIDANGQVQTRSQANMQGYYRDDELTRKTLVDGFLQTGDCGEIDADGYLRLTGRLKDAFKTSKGKYVIPAPLEAKLLESPLLDNAAVVGTDLTAPVALVVLSGSGRALSPQALTPQLKALVDRVNSTLEDHEKLAYLIIVADEWTLENGLLTPTLKVKRNVLERQYLEKIRKWFGKIPAIYFEPRS